MISCHPKTKKTDDLKKNDSTIKTNSVKVANDSLELLNENKVENNVLEKPIVKYSANSFYNRKIKVDSNNVPINDGQFYFPLRLFPDIDFQGNIIKNKYDTSVVIWYSEKLYALKEPLLFNKKITKEIFRFTWLRTFHNPIAIRIEKENLEYKLYWKVCDGAGGYAPGNLIIDTFKVINQNEWDIFQKKLNKIDYWNMPLGRGFAGCDGAEWILEGVNSSKYHVITIWGELDCCRYLINLTGLKIPDDEIY